MCARPFLSWVSQTLKTLGSQSKRSRKKSRPARRVQPCLTVLEDRVVPSVFTVNSTADTHAVNLTTGQDANGNITLRSAIEAANSLGGTNSVALPGGAITLTLGTITIAASDNVTVSSTPSTTISGNKQATVFTVSQGSTMTLDNAVIEDGQAAQGGGIFNAGSLTLSDTTVTTNLATGPNGTASTTVNGGNGEGGGIYNTATGTLTLNSTIIENNTAQGGSSVNSGAGGPGFGGGIYMAGGDVILDSNDTISSNTVLGGGAGGIASGGGIYVAGGALTVDQSTLQSNSAHGAGGSSGSSSATSAALGGGLFLGSASATVTITNSTFSGNEAVGGANGSSSVGASALGGAIADQGGNLTLTNDTLADNAVTGGSGSTSGAAQGGGLYNNGGDSIQLTNVTITGNTSGVVNQAGTVNVLNTIIAGNSSGDVSGKFTSSGFNLIGDGTGSNGFGSMGDQVGTASNPINPLLGNLGNYGGPTQTIPLLPGSPAIDAGTNTVGLVPSTDQRGKPRVGAVDIGAFESQGFTLTIVQGNNQSANLNSAFGQPLEVQVQSNDGSPISNGSESGAVSFTVQPNAGASATLSSDTAAIGGNGVAEVTATANGVAGSYTVTASLTGVGSDTFNLTNLGTTSAITPIAGNGQTAVVGTPFAQQLEVAVTNATGAAVGGESVTFMAPASGASGTFTGGTDSITVTTDSNGIALAPIFTADNSTGSYTVTASVAGQSPSATFTETNVAASTTTPLTILPVSGDGQSTAINTSFGQLLEVQVEDSSFFPVGGASVTFTAPASGASGTFANGSDSVTVTTGFNGIAMAPVLTANGTAGPFMVTADVAGNATIGSASFTETNLATGNGNPADLTIVSGDNQAAPVNFGFGQPFEVAVTDSKGDPLSGVSVTFTAPSSGPSGTFQAAGDESTTVVTNAAGDATTTLFTANGTQGTYAVTATVPTDNAVPAAYFVATNAASTFGLTAIAGNDQNATVNTPYAQNLEVLVRDVSGHPLGNESVTFTVAQTGGAEATFPGGSDSVTVVTNSNGIATAPVLTANGTAGTVTVQATAPGVTQSAFFLLDNNAAGGAAGITVVNGNNQNTLVNTPFPQPLEVRVTDANGNPLGDVSVAFQFTSGDDSFQTSGGNVTSETVTTNSSGIATSDTVVAGPTPGMAIALANATDVAQSAEFTLDSFPATGSPASITVLSGNNQTVEVNSPFPQPLTVVVKDGSGNPLGNETVTFTAPTSGASGLFGTQTTTTAVTDSNGDASVNFTANGTPGGYDVTASVPGVAGDALFALTNSATAAPARIVIISGNNQSTVTNTTFSQPLQVEVEDANGNPVSDSSVTFTAPASGASGTFSNGQTTFTVTTDAAGIATVPGFKANGTTGTYTVTVSANGVSTPVTFSLTNTAETLASTITFPTGTTAFTPTTWTGTITGTASSSPLSVASVKVSILDQTSNQYWNGSAFVVSATPIFLTATGTTSWSLPLPASELTDNHTYVISSEAVDTAGNVQSPPTTQTFSFTNPNITLQTVTVGLTVSSTQVGVGQGVTVNVTVTPTNSGSATPTGTVQIFDGTTMLTTLTLANGSASTTLSNLAQGTHSLSAVYSGDNIYATATSSSTTVTVGAVFNASKVATFNNGVWEIDDQGNGGAPQTVTYGLPGDIPIVGDWNGAGFDEIGVVRTLTNITLADGNHPLEFILNVTGTGIYTSADEVFIFGESGDKIVLGDWNGDGKTKVGVVRAGSDGDLVWSLDFNGNFATTGQYTVYQYGLGTDSPVVGDWNGQGKDEIGVVRPSNGTLAWTLDSNGNGTFDSSDEVLFFGLPGDHPIVGDWTGSGATRIGTYRPASNGLLAFSLDKQGNGVYQPSDAAFYGLSTDQGLVGDWTGTGVDRIGVDRPATNAADLLFALDANGDGTFDSGDQAFAFGQAGGQVLVGRWKPV
jgi:Bacterial Ig-like domain (group 3)